MGGTGGSGDSEKGGGVGNREGGGAVRACENQKRSRKSSKELKEENKIEKSNQRPVVS